MDVNRSVHISVFVLREFTVREVEHEFEQSDDVARNQSLFLQEIVSPIMLVYSFFNGGDWFYFGKKKPGFLKRAWRKYLPFPFNRPKPNMRMSTKVAVGLWLAHYFNRAIIYGVEKNFDGVVRWLFVLLCLI